MAILWKTAVPKELPLYWKGNCRNFAPIQQAIRYADQTKKMRNKTKPPITIALAMIDAKIEVQSVRSIDNKCPALSYRKADHTSRQHRHDYTNKQTIYTYYKRKKVTAFLSQAVRRLYSMPNLNTANTVMDLLWRLELPLLLN